MTDILVNVLIVVGIGGIVYSVLVVLVVYRRHKAARWSPGSGASPITDPPFAVWFSDQPPRRGRGRRSLEYAQLWISAEAIEIERVVQPSIQFVPPVSVQPGHFGTDLVNVWIRLDVAASGDRDRGSFCFICDSRWWGWRGLLTNSNLRLAESIWRVGRP